MTLSLATLGADVSAVVTALAPMVEAADPEIAAAVVIGQKIVQGAIALEPTAVALYNSIKSGTPPTTAQLTAFNNAYEAAYQQLNTDINAKLATAT